MTMRTLLILAAIALVKCKSCGGEVSSKAYSCPHCGHPMRKPPAARLQDFGPSSDYLPRNDWLSSLIGALLCRLGCGRGAPRDHALPGGLLGGAEVVRRMASHEPQRIP